MSSILTTPLTLRNNDTAMMIPEDPYLSKMGDTWDILIGLVILFVIMSSIILNSLVLWTLIRLKKARLQKQSANSDYYIITLAASDLLVSLTCYPFTFVSTIYHRWLFGEIGCTINGFFGFLFSLIDVGALTLMSLHRLLSVKMPHCAFVKSAGYTWLALSGVVLYALGWTISPLLGWGRFSPEPFGTSCTVDWKNPNRSYVTSVFVGVLAIPLIVMLVCYSSVVSHMRSTSAKLGQFLTERNTRAKRQNRLVRIAVLMCTCFLVIWLPYAVLSICFAYVPGFSVHPVHSAIPTVLAKTSHVVNPLICFGTHKSYRRRVKSSLRYFFMAKPDLETSKSCQASTDLRDGKSKDFTTQLTTRPCIIRSHSIHLRLHRAVSQKQRLSQNVSSFSKDNNTERTIEQDFSDNSCVIIPIPYLSYGSDATSDHLLNNKIICTEPSPSAVITS